MGASASLDPDPISCLVDIGSGILQCIATHIVTRVRLYTFLNMAFQGRYDCMFLGMVWQPLPKASIASEAGQTTAHHRGIHTRGPVLSF